MQMVRFHRKRLVAVSIILLSFCSFVIFLISQHEPYNKESEIDPELMKLLVVETRRPKITQKPTPPPKPEVHVKEIPSPVVKINMTFPLLERMFFKFLENKAVRCENDQRLGNQHDGGWNVCLSGPFRLKQPCIIFSFGIGSDWQFDDAVSKIYGCRVLAFDPSMPEPDSRRSPLIEFRQTGIGARNEISKEGWKLKTLGTHLKDEGYWGVPVDYVKIDAEYTEWAALKTAFAEGALQHVKQLGFEIHSKNFLRKGNKTEKAAHESLSPSKREMEEKLDFVHMYETLHQLEILNFRKFNYRNNPFGNYRSNFTKKERSCCYELHYVNLDFLSKNDTIVHTKDSKLFH